MALMPDVAVCIGVAKDQEAGGGDCQEQNEAP